MRETLIILVVILILLTLTAIKYRLQISTIIGVTRMIRKAVKGTSAVRGEHIEEPINSGKLVSCTKCGTWVPELNAIKFGGGKYFCTDSCLQGSIKTV